MLRISKERVFDIYIIVMCLICALYGMTNGKSYGSLQSLNVLVLCAVLMFTNYEETFLLLVALIPYYQCFVISGVSIRGIIFIIPIFKLLKHMYFPESKRGVLFVGLILMLVEFFNDILHVDITSILNNILPMVYFCFFAVALIDKDKWNVKKISFYYIISSLISNVVVLIGSGGLQSYYNDISYYRFGQSNSYLAGAMEVPIYCCISMLIAFSILIWEKQIKPIERIGLLFIIAANFIFGMLSVSRVFIIGLACVFAFLFIELNTRFDLKRNVMIVIGGFVLLFALDYFYGDLLTLLSDKLFNRLNFSHDNSRTLIWKSVFKYQFSNIKSFLIGEGSISYSLIGKEKGLDFAMMAHNLILDIWMSWGMVGLFSMAVLILSQFDMGIRKHPLSYSIIVTFFMMMMVGGSFNFCRNYIYILFAVFFANYSYMYMTNSERINI